MDCKVSGVYLGGLVSLALKVIQERKVKKEDKEGQKLEIQVSQVHQVLPAQQGSANRVNRVSQAHLDIMGQREREDTPASRVNQECAIHQCATVRYYEEIRSVKGQTIETA